MDIKITLGQLRKQILEILPCIDEVNEDKISEIFLTYDFFIRPNFIKWLILNRPLLKSEIAIKAVDDNLRCEIDDNHPQMLLDFMEPIIRNNIDNDIITKNIENKIKDNIHLINKITKSSVKPLEGLLIMAILENTSINFVDWMKKASDKVGLKNKKYLDVHGEADISHANEFVNAFNAELEIMKDYPVNLLEETKEDVLILLKVIFVI